MAKIYSSKKSNESTAESKELCPRPHVITNLLNYSKSLEVKSTTSGRKIGVILN
jgi:hypothetical protein